MCLRQQVDDAVAARFLAIRKGLKRRTGDYLYDGHRCLPEELGWRFRQNLSLKLHEPGGLAWNPYPELPAEIEEGKHDGKIEHTWHDGASAEWYYTHEKDYGRDEPEPDYFEDDWLDEEEEADDEHD